MISRKLFLTASVAALSVASVTAPIYTKAATKVFKDVPTSHPYYKEISEMTSKGIIHGYENGTFKPNELITRQHAAALLARAYPSKEKHSLEFKDMKKSHAYHADMSLAIKSRWLDTDNGSARPSDTITRGEMAEAISRAAKLSRDKGWWDHPFKDVNEKTNYVAGIAALYNAGVTTGYEDKTFKADQGLSRAHYSVFMYRAMKHNEKLQEEHKNSLLGSTYIGQYEKGKVPKPTGVTHDQQWSEFEKLKALLPKGGAAGVIPGGEPIYYESSLKKISSITGTEVKVLSEYLNNSAKTGNLIYFNGGNGNKYFIGFHYLSNGIAYGEDHR